MIPESLVNLTSLKKVVQPSKTYKLDLQQKRIKKMIDGIEAAAQAVVKIISTERYSEVIYSGQYGVELNRFIGQNFDFVTSDLLRTIQEALKVDDRVDSITDFKWEKIKSDALEVSFNVNTVYGKYPFIVEVAI